MTITVLSGGTELVQPGTMETWSVSSSSGLPTTPFYVVDPAEPLERFEVTLVSGTTWTVVRGADFSQIVAHAFQFGVNVVNQGTSTPPPSGAYVAVQGTPSAGQVPVFTGTGNTATPTATVTVDTTDTPQGPSANPTPGTGANGASAEDHVHPLPTSAQLQALGTLTTETLPLWEWITDGNVTLPRTQQADSGSYGGTPASGTVHYTYFLAQQSMDVGHIRFQTAGTAAATGTYANVGLYSVNTSSGALTLMAAGSPVAALNGTYAGQTFALSTAQQVVQGTLYAVGLLQVATTPASLIGQWFNGVYLGGQQAIAQVGATGLTALPTTATKPNGASAFPIYYELVA